MVVNFGLHARQIAPLNAKCRADNNTFECSMDGQQQNDAPAQDDRDHQQQHPAQMLHPK